jgi:aminocarboxymuconate-semialdehyde decarboxylase
VKKRSTSLRVDIHCHYLNTQVAERVTPLNPAQHEPMAVYSNAATRAANANQGKERGAKLTDIALRLKEMDKMGVDIQAVSPAPHQLRR